MKRQLRQPFSLGDVDDVEAYVRAIVVTLPLSNKEERDEFVAHGLYLVAHRHAGLGSGESLSQALGGWLRRRLQDHWRQHHREWRRNSRAATSYSLGTPTGLAWEQGDEQTHDLAGGVSFDRVDSAIMLSRFKSEEQLRDPREIGRFVRVPSWAALGTGKAEEIWAAIEAERELITPRPPRRRFGFEPNL